MKGKRLLSTAGLVLVMAMGAGGMAAAAVTTTAQKAPTLNMHRVSRTCWESQQINHHAATVCVTKQRVLKVKVVKVPPPCVHCTVKPKITLTAALRPHVSKFYIRNGAGGDMGYAGRNRWFTQTSVRRHGLKFEETDVRGCTSKGFGRCFQLEVVGTNKCITIAKRARYTYLQYRPEKCARKTSQLFFYNQVRTPGHALQDWRHLYCMEGFEAQTNLADPSCKPIVAGQESWYFRTRF